MRQLNVLPWYLFKWNSWSNHIKILVKIHWCIESYILLFLLFLLVCIELTIINTIWAFIFDLHIGRINPGTFGEALTFRCSRVSDIRCHCLALCQIHSLPPSCLRSHLDYPSLHYSQANFHCPKCFLVHYPHSSQIDDSWFCLFSG